MRRVAEALYRMRITEPGQLVTEVRLASFDVDDAKALATAYFQSDPGILLVEVLYGHQTVFSLNERD